MMRTTAFLLCILLAAAPLAAQEKAPLVPIKPREPAVGKVYAPKAIITGPTSAYVGDLIHLTWDTEGVDHSAVYVTPERFSDGRPTFERQGEGVWIASRAGTYTVDVIVSNAAGVDRGRQVIVVSGGTAPPLPGPTPLPPGPTPAPTPTPPLPPTPQPAPAGLAGEVAAMVSLVPTAPGAALLALADGCEGVDAQIAAGTLQAGGLLYSGSRKIMAALEDGLNRVAVENGGTATWKPFADAYKTKLKAMFGAGKLATNDDFRGALQETSKGLRFAAVGRP